MLWFSVLILGVLGQPDDGESRRHELISACPNVATQCNVSTALGRDERMSSFECVMKVNASAEDQACRDVLTRFQGLKRDDWHDMQNDIEQSEKMIATLSIACSHEMKVCGPTLKTSGQSRVLEAFSCLHAMSRISRTCLNEMEECQKDLNKAETPDRRTKILKLCPDVAKKCGVPAGPQPSQRSLKTSFKCLMQVNNATVAKVCAPVLTEFQEAKKELWERVLTEKNFTIGLPSGTRGENLAKILTRVHDEYTYGEDGSSDSSDDKGNDSNAAEGKALISACVARVAFCRRNASEPPKAPKNEPAKAAPKNEPQASTKNVPLPKRSIRSGDDEEVVSLRQAPAQLSDTELVSCIRSVSDDDIEDSPECTAALESPSSSSSDDEMIVLAGPAMPPFLRMGGMAPMGPSGGMMGPLAGMMASSSGMMGPSSTGMMGPSITGMMGPSIMIRGMMGPSMGEMMGPSIMGGMGGGMGSLMMGGMGPSIMGGLSVGRMGMPPMMFPMRQMPSLGPMPSLMQMSPEMSSMSPMLSSMGSDDLQDAPLHDQSDDHDDHESDPSIEQLLKMLG